MPRTDLTEGLIGWCRAGFEPELAAEFTQHAAERGISGYAKAERGQGLARYVLTEPGSLDSALARLAGARIFARAVQPHSVELRDLSPDDRIGPIIDALKSMPAPRFGSLSIEHADSDAGKPLAGLARALASALRAALRKHGLLSPTDNARLPRLQVALLLGTHVLLGIRRQTESNDWPSGIPRLRLAREAPSRSALKLEEALRVLLDADERERWLKPGQRAADLGAAPGGWSWVLARNHLQVTAIDNGPLAESAHATGLIEHVRADGFSWRPAKPVDWMVCDMVEQPSRVAQRMSTWLEQGWCRQSIFNLKLPMKKRWEEVQRCLEIIRPALGERGVLRARQLYHDREEITVFAKRGAS